jgi:hypothetical protein
MPWPPKSPDIIVLDFFLLALHQEHLICRKNDRSEYSVATVAQEMFSRKRLNIGWVFVGRRVLHVLKFVKCQVKLLYF